MRWYRWWPVGIIVLLAVILFFPVWGRGQYYLGFDILGYFHPWFHGVPRVQNAMLSDPLFHNYIEQHFLWASLQSFWSGNGAIWWRADQFCGFPGGGVSLDIFKVLTLSIWSPGTAMACREFVYVALAGVMMFAFLREYRLRQIPALLGAVAWMLNGFVMVWLEYEFTVAYAALCPAALYFIERWWKTGSWRPWVGVACCFSLAVAFAFAHMIIYYFLFIAAYLTWRGLAGREWRKLPARAAAMIGAVAVAVALGHGVLSGGLSALDASQRTAYSFAELIANTGQVHGRFLLTLFYPSLFTTPDMGMSFIPRLSTQAYNNYNEICVFAGFLTLALAWAGMVFYRRRCWFFLLVAAFALASALGTAVYYPLARWVPGLALSTPTRILFFWGLALAVLAAFGLQALLYSRRNRGLVLTVLAVPAVLAVATAVAVNYPPFCQWLMPEACRAFGGNLPFWVEWQSERLWLPLVFALVQTALAAAVLTSAPRRRTVLALTAVLALAAQLLVFAMSYNATSARSEAFPVTGGIKWLQEQPRPFRCVLLGDRFIDNAFSVFGLECLGGYQGVYGQRVGGFLKMCATGKPDVTDIGYRWIGLTKFNFGLFSLANVKYLITPPGSPTISHPGLKLVYDADLKIYQNQTCLPRVFWTPGAQRADEATVRDMMCRATVSGLAGTVLLEHNGAPIMTDPVTPATTGGCTITDYRPDRLTVRMQASQRGYLVVGNSYNPEWTATVDGEAVSLEPADYNFMALPVPAGAHEVVVAFKPSSRGLLWLGFSYALWLILAVAAVIAWSRPLRRRQE